MNWKDFTHRMRSLSRLENQSSVGGVCAGIAYTFELPVWIVQMVFLLGLLFFSFTAVVYLVLWVVLPEKKITDEEFESKTQNADKNDTSL